MSHIDAISIFSLVAVRPADATIIPTMAALRAREHPFSQGRKNISAYILYSAKRPSLQNRDRPLDGAMAFKNARPSLPVLPSLPALPALPAKPAYTDLTTRYLRYLLFSLVFYFSRLLLNPLLHSFTAFFSLNMSASVALCF